VSCKLGLNVPARSGQIFRRPGSKPCARITGTRIVLPPALAPPASVARVMVDATAPPDDDTREIVALLALAPRTYVVNVGLNILGGAAVALGALLTPFLLARHLSAADFATWAVCFPVVGYSALLGVIFNGLMIQGIAPFAVRRDVRGARNFVTTLVVGSLLSNFLFCLLVAGMLAPLVAKWTNASSAGLLQVADIWRTLGLAAGLASSLTIVNGLFNGLQRYEWDNLYKITLNGCFTLCVLTMIWLDKSHISVAVPLFVFAQCAALAIIVAAGLKHELWRLFSPRAFSLATARLLGARATGSLVWQTGMLLVTGFDLLMTTRFEPRATPGYALALACVGACSGLLGAVFAPMVPRLARLRVVDGPDAVKAMFLKYQRILLVILVSVWLTLNLAPHAWWLRVLPRDSQTAFFVVLPILTTAMVIRSSTSVYAGCVMSAGLQHRIILTPLLEGVLNLAFSYFLGLRFGAWGVAMGTLFGAGVSVAGHSLYNSPRTQFAVALRPWQLIFPSAHIKRTKGRESSNVGSS
jgi:O-antigen/teichoic acid export membrane protein